MQNLALIDQENPVEVQLRKSSTELVEHASNIVIFTRADLSVATDIVKAIKNRHKDIEEERTRIVKPFNEGVKAINARFKAMTAPLEDAETDLKGKMLVFQREEERKAREEAARLEKVRCEQEEKERAEWAAKEKERLRLEAEEAKRVAAEGNEDDIRSMPLPVAETPVYVPPPAIVAPAHKPTTYGQTGAVSTVKKQWAFELADIRQLAAARPDLVIVDTVKINQEIRGRGGNIAGLHIFEKDILQVR